MKIRNQFLLAIALAIPATIGSAASLGSLSMDSEINIVGDWDFSGARTIILNNASVQAVSGSYMGKIRPGDTAYFADLSWALDGEVLNLPLEPAWVTQSLDGNGRPWVAAFSLETAETSGSREDDDAELRGQGWMYLYQGTIDVSNMTFSIVQSYDPTWGDYLVTQSGAIFSTSNTPVPVPAAAWLFGSGLLGLAGVARKRKVA